MKRTIWVWLCLCCLLTGCTDWYRGRYVSVTPYVGKNAQALQQNTSVTGYDELYAFLQQIIWTGQTDAVVTVEGYHIENLKYDLDRAARDLIAHDPVANYAVLDIIGESGEGAAGLSLDVKIQYSCDPAQVQSIRQVNTMEEAEALVASALNQCDAGLVMKIDNYRTGDFANMVETYALENPHLVMEVPRVTVKLYPSYGRNRVAELRFFYQSSRDSLKIMQSKVLPVFTSASLYASEDASDLEKYNQLHSFLKERYDYRIETSITPAYSLLHHGVGDSKAFSSVYGAMCRLAGLDARLVTGTCHGESRNWVIVCVDGRFYHLDLMDGSFRLKTDDEMIGYVWDYSSHPAC